MYLKRTIILILGISTVIIGMSFSVGPGSDCSPLNSSGAPDGVCGDPMGGGATCKTAGCHAIGPVPATQTNWITSNVPGAGYTPGGTYTFVATATRAGHTRFGFEISPQNSSGTPLGTLVISDPANTQLTSTNFYVTHTSAGTTGTTGFHSWTFNWTAPAVGSGPVTFYGAFNISNANNAVTGDTIMTSNLTINENTSIGIATNGINSNSFSVYPNPVSDKLNVRYSVSENSRVEILVMDLHGRTIEVLMSENKAHGSFIQSYGIDRSKYQTGFYFIKISTGKDSKLQKVLLQ